MVGDIENALASNRQHLNFNSVLIKTLHKIFGHNTDCDFLVFCFAAWLPATALHDLLRDKFLVSYIMRSSETVPQDAHTKFILVLRFTFSSSHAN